MWYCIYCFTSAKTYGKKVQTLHPEDSENWQHRDLANNHKKWILKRSRKNIIWNIWQGHFLSPPPFTERKWRSSALCSLPVLCKSCSPPATKKCRDMKQWWLKYPDPETLHPMQMQGLSHLYHEAGVCLNIYHVLCEAQPLDESKLSQTTWTKSCHP